MNNPRNHIDKWLKVPTDPDPDTPLKIHTNICLKILRDGLTLLRPDIASKAFSDIASKRMHLVIQNFLTFPKYQKQKFWKNLNSIFFLVHSPRRGVLKK